VSDAYDVIVVGSGLGGLAAGALAAASGRRVLLLEKNPSFGGAASVYRVRDLTIEASLHEIDGFDPSDPKVQVLEQLGILDKLDLVDVGDLYEVRSPLLGEPFVMPAGLDRAREATARRFPHQAKALADYFDRLDGIRRSVLLLGELEANKRRLLLNLPVLPWRIRHFIRHRKATVAGILDRLFGGDEAVKLAVAGLLSYYTEDASRMWFPRYATAQASYHIGGGHYPRGGSKVVTETLLERIRSAGGQTESGVAVRRVVLEDGRVRGVEYEHNGATSEAQAPIVFGNASPNALAALLPDDVRPAFEARYAERSPSVSLWTIALGLSRKPRELGVTQYSTVFFPDWLTSLGQLPESVALMASDPGERMPYAILVDYTAVDTGLTPNAPYLATLCGLDSAESWRGGDADSYRARREAWMDALVGMLDREFPGFGAAVTQREMTTALSVERYLGTPNGAIYGFAPDVPPKLQSVFDPETAIPGLWLASAWTGVGGYSGAILGGAIAVRQALKASAS
jgi:phytoene dehydrogenase-like protein